MAHFKEWLFISPLFETPNLATSEASGSPSTAERANRRWKQLLASYEDPGLDPAIEEELDAFVERRKADPLEPED